MGKFTALAAALIIGVGLRRHRSCGREDEEDPGDGAGRAADQMQTAMNTLTKHAKDECNIELK